MDSPEEKPRGVSEMQAVPENAEERTQMKPITAWAIVSPRGEIVSRIVGTKREVENILWEPEALSYPPGSKVKKVIIKVVK